MNYKMTTIAAATSAMLTLGFAGNALADTTDDIINALVDSLQKTL